MRGAVALFGAAIHPVLCSLRTVIVFPFEAQVQLHNIHLTYIIHLLTALSSFVPDALVHVH